MGCNSSKEEQSRMLMRNNYFPSIILSYWAKKCHGIVFEVEIVYGSASFPQTWQEAIVEIRSAELVKPLTLRRFLTLNQIPKMPWSQHAFELRREINQNNFYDMKGIFNILKVPQAIQQFEEIPENYQLFSESVIVKLVAPKICNPFTKQYQQLYQEQYYLTFKEIEAQQTNSSGITVGILDLPQNFYIMGIDNYQMTQCIIRAYIKYMLEPENKEIRKIVFITESLKQAQTFAIASKQFFEDLMNQTLSVEDEIIYEKKLIEKQEERKSIMEEEEKKEIMPQQQQDLQFNVQNQQKQMNLQIIQEDGQIEQYFLESNKEININNNQIQEEFAKKQYIKMHLQKQEYNYFRDANENFRNNVHNYLPINNPDDLNHCICDKQLKSGGFNTFCSYCRISKRARYQCTYKGCLRTFCSNCKISYRNYNRCQKNHELKYKTELQNYECEMCYRVLEQNVQFDERSIKVGIYECNSCGTQICGLCYLAKYAYFQERKVFSQKSKFVQIFTQIQALKQMAKLLRPELLLEIVDKFLQNQVKLFA